MIQGLEKHKKVAVQFNSAVLVLPSDFSDVPKAATIPQGWPDVARPWLASTWCVDAKNDRIAKIAKKIRSESDFLEIIAMVEQRSRKFSIRLQEECTCRYAFVLLNDFMFLQEI